MALAQLNRARPVDWRCIRRCTWPLWYHIHIHARFTPRSISYYVLACCSSDYGRLPAGGIAPRWNAMLTPRKPIPYRRCLRPRFQEVPGFRYFHPYMIHNTVCKRLSKKLGLKLISSIGSFEVSVVWVNCNYSNDSSSVCWMSVSLESRVSVKLDEMLLSKLAWNFVTLALKIQFTVYSSGYSSPLQIKRFSICLGVRLLTEIIFYIIDFNCNRNSQVYLQHWRIFVSRKLKTYFHCQKLICNDNSIVVSRWVCCFALVWLVQFVLWDVEIPKRCHTCGAYRVGVLTPLSL